jgi:ribosomal protein S18 acetylase RimI-like enzyme
MKDVTIRPMTAEDARIIASWMVTLPLWQRYQVKAEAAQAQFERALDTEDILLVADQDERAVGFTWCLPKGGFGLSAYLKLIGVRHAGAGIGVALLDETERRARDISKDMFLLVSDFNLDAQRFYRRQGYEQIGAVPGYVLPDVAELIFRKRLS